MSGAPVAATLDCRGLSCPEPAMQVNDLLRRETPPALTVSVDNSASRDNVERVLRKNGYTVTITAAAGVYSLAAVRV